MKKLKVLGIALTAIFMMIAVTTANAQCPGAKPSCAKTCGDKAAASTTTAKTVVYNVKKIHCDGCKTTIETALAKEKGVARSSVNVADKTVTVTFNSTETNEETIMKTLAKTGYKAEACKSDKACCDSKKDGSGKKAECTDHK